MTETTARAIAIVGLGSILPDAPDVDRFWQNVTSGRYSISDVDPDRWDPALYYDPDPAAPDKSYSKIGGWVRDYAWEPFQWKLAIPPKVGDAMDTGQKWAVACTHQALVDYGYPERHLDNERTAVILGNAMAGEKHYLTGLRIWYPEYARWLERSATFGELSGDFRSRILEELHQAVTAAVPGITEDTMPGELANVIAGRIANLYNFRGPNFVCDAACASAMAAISAAVEGLHAGDFDAVITGGIDRNMGASTFVKFCKIGALSATGTRPYSEGADGFVMGEGASIFLLKRLEDAERDGDRVYAVLRGLAGSSDGKGKGITAPNPVGQELAVRRAWQKAGVSPATVSMVEGHGTSTRVGDRVEVESLMAVFDEFGLPAGSVALGSVKSNIGHLKAAAGSAGILKATLALHHKQLPPSLGFSSPNPHVDWDRSAFRVNTDLRDWPEPQGGVRRAGVSAFGFGGTNFHVVLEEYLPGRLKRRPRSRGDGASRSAAVAPPQTSPRAPLRGAVVLGAHSARALKEQLDAIAAEARAGRAPTPRAPSSAALGAPERLAIDFADAADLATRAGRASKALAVDQPAMWKALRPQGIHRGSGPPPKIAFLYTGQGSQYVGMLQELRRSEPVVADVFDEADRVTAPLLGKPLSQFIFVDRSDKLAAKQAEADLSQTAITQPAVLATDIALTKLLGAYGITPDLVMGHSLGEYGALVAAGSLTFADALEAVSARGREMANVSVADNGKMAAVFAPIEAVEEVLASVDGYVVIANVNSHHQAVIGGASAAVEEAVAAFQRAGVNAISLNVSHAFHTRIVAPASEPLRRSLVRLALQPPRLPIVGNVTGELYPMGPDAVPAMLDLLSAQVASPVQFVRGLNTLYDQGARVFVEVGPKRALWGLVEDVLGTKADVVGLFTNHPKLGDVASFNQALCGLYAAGLGAVSETRSVTVAHATQVDRAPVSTNRSSGKVMARQSQKRTHVKSSKQVIQNLGELFAGFLEQGMNIYSGRGPGLAGAAEEPVVISGAAVGLPGLAKVFNDDNVSRLLHGEQLIDVIPARHRGAMVDKRITRLVKSASGGGSFVTIDSARDVIKLAGRAGTLDLTEEFGVSEKRVDALDTATQLAIAAGLEALHDAGIPLVLYYKTTTTGKHLPERWMLPPDLRDDTGIIFGSAFPGYDRFADHLTRFHEDKARRERLAELESLWGRARPGDATATELARRIDELKRAIDANGYQFDRRFLFQILSMGHSQFAELIGARGPNTQINAACASGTQGISLAEDWIRSGRCRRVIVITADNVTSDRLIGWIGSGFLATGAAATDELVEEAALPFDRRRHGMLIGMGASGIVVESAEAAAERGVAPICEVLGTITANSAFHGTRLDVEHITQGMERLVSQAEARWGVDRHAIAPETVFVSHETYTPARGGSASAEVHSLRAAFGSLADEIVVTNTKGYTGHAMGAGIEDVLAVKSLETGLVPAVANFKEVDPELGRLNLSQGGSYPVEYALRLAAGFGSQLSIMLLRRVAASAGRPRPDQLGYGYRIADRKVFESWLSEMTGYERASLEVVKRTLMVANQGPAAAILARPRKARPTPKASASPAVVSAPVPALAPAPAPVAPFAPSSDPVVNRVLAIVSEQTGYGPEMLDLDLDMEGHLGVDTVKRAEIFRFIREQWDIERDDDLRLRDFPTLRHVVGYVHDNRPDLAPAEPASEPVSAPVVAEPGTTAVIDPVSDRVLAIVSAETGYPADMLELDLDLEADLGIDTVKQAEIFRAIRETWDIAAEETLQLRDFPTLQHVIGYVRDRRPDLAAPPLAPATPQSTPAAADSEGDDPVVQEVLAIVAEQTGYPVDMLELDLDLEADLGIDTVKQAEMFRAIRETYEIAQDDNMQLRDFPTLSHVIDWVRDNRPDLAAPPQAPATPQSTPAAADSEGDDPIVQQVLAIVAEQTGYPTDMLELDLDLEADLGIDTVKQAEMFRAVRETWQIGRDDDMQLRDFPTLQHVVQFVLDRRQDGAEAVAAPAEPAEPRAADLALAEGVPRRVPVAVLRPPLGVCKPTGVTLGEGSRIVVMPDGGGVSDKLVDRLADRGAELFVIDPTWDADALTAALDEWVEAGSVTGVYWLPALDDEGALAELTGEAWHEGLRRRVKLAFATARALYAHLGSPGAFWVAATRLGGLHGCGDDGASAPMGGAVTGFTKALKRERADCLVKAVDFAPGRETAELAERLIAETETDPGAVEVGYRDGDRFAISVTVEPAAEATDALALTPDSVFVVTGAAGSIVSAIVADLAADSGGAFWLLDLTPDPDRDDPDLAAFRSDPDGLKRTLFQRLKDSGERATPAVVNRQMAGLERKDAALAAIEAVEAAGGVAHYRSVDLNDGGAIAAIIDEVRQAHGRIDVLLHAAGVEISHLVPDKTPREFDLVFDVKSNGWFHLMKAIGDLPLSATMAFSSIAGRFGNGGQTDYSAANDLLCKMASHLNGAREGTRSVAIDWTAWADIGMASRGSIPTMMARAGIDMLPPEVGIPAVRRELVTGTRGEVVVAGSLGALMDELDETGGLDPAALTERAAGPMLDRVVGMSLHGGLTAEATLEPCEQGFLNDHRIDGVPVLPGVMGVEGFAELATLLWPDRLVASIEDVSFLAPFKFYRDEARTITLQARFRPDGSSIVADCRLLGYRDLPGRAEPQETEHFRARVRLARELPSGAAAKAPGDVSDAQTVAARDIYRVYFHGPAYQVTERGWRDGDAVVGVLSDPLTANHSPADKRTVTAPRLLELCFQTAGLSEIGATGQMGLPQAVDRVVTRRATESPDEGRLYAVVRPAGSNGGFDAQVVDSAGTVYVEMYGYRTVRVPGSVEESALAPIRRVMGPL